MYSGKPNRLVARYSTAGSSGLAGPRWGRRSSRASPHWAQRFRPHPCSPAPARQALFEFVPAYRLSPSIAGSAVSSPNSTAKGTACLGAATADQSNGLFWPLASERTLPRLVAGQRNAVRRAGRPERSGRRPPVHAAYPPNRSGHRGGGNVSAAQKGSPPGHERSCRPGNGRMRQASRSPEDSSLENSARFSTRVRRLAAQAVNDALDTGRKRASAEPLKHAPGFGLARILHVLLAE